MIKIEFPADRLDIARAMAEALHRIGYGSETEASETDPKPSTGASTSRPEAAPTAGVAEECQTTSGSASVEDVPKPPAESLFDGPSAGTAEVAEEAGMDQATTQLGGSPADARLDLNGVAFNAAYCGQAAEPFYATGKTRGRWKKKKGVDQGDYDAWYADQLPQHEAFGGATDHAVNAGAAFGAPVAEAPADVPTDAPSLMVWISERQAADELTQRDVNEAYQVTGVTMNDLFGDDPAPSVAAIHTFLLSKVR